MAFADEQSRRSGGSLVQRELSPQATEGLFLSCEFCNPSASRCSAPPFTQGRRKVVVVAFATAVQICKCQTFSEGFQPCQHHALIGLSKPPALPVVMTRFICAKPVVFIASAAKVNIVICHIRNLRFVFGDILSFFCSVSTYFTAI